MAKVTVTTNNNIVVGVIDVSEFDFTKNLAIHAFYIELRELIEDAEKIEKNN